MKFLLAVSSLCLFVAFASACSDKHRSCAYYKSKGYCTQRFVSWMKVNCQKTCGFCTGGGGGGSGSCGRSSVQQSRIIAGEDAKPGAWPWMASLWMYGRSHICGGTLISPRWILTASHCVVGTGASTKTMQIKLGEHSHRNSDGNEQVINIEKIVSHESYSRSSLRNDIALIKLAKPARLNSRVQTICLPSRSSRPAIGSRQCYLSGWGTIQHPGSVPDILQQAMLPVVGSKNCFNRNDVVCSGYGKTKLTNACRGDSGGPFVCRKSDGSWEQHGVASFVVTYCKYYTGFTAVGDYVDWIKGKMSRN